MSDLLLFFIGGLVSCICAAAAGLLIWGAANEPRPGESLEQAEARRAAREAARKREAEPVPVRVSTASTEPLSPSR